MYNLAHLEYIVTDLTLKTNIINMYRILLRKYKVSISAFLLLPIVLFFQIFFFFLYIYIFDCDTILLFILKLFLLFICNKPFLS